MNAVTHMRAERAPFSVEAEQQLLGAFLLISHAPVGDALAKAIRSGGVELFHDPVHYRIFEVMAEKHRAGELISPVTVFEAMRGDDGLAQLGGGGYLARMAGSAMTAAAGDYVDLLADLRWKRQMCAVMSEAQAAIATGAEDASIISGRMEAALVLAQGQTKSGPVSMAKAVSIALDQIYAAYQGNDQLLVKSGIPALDKMVSGFYPGELILIGGRPSMGKTAVALSIGLNAARAGHGVVIASLEMNPEAMAMRALSEATANNRDAVTYAAMRKGDMQEHQARSLHAISKQVGELPIMFLPRQFSDIGALFSGAKQAQRAMGGKMRLLIVDYAQLLRSPAKTRYEQITEISIALKALAGQLDMPVIALSQLSRSLESRDDKRPMMSDLRESGQLEQDADAIMFCYRDEYYLEREKPSDPNDVEAYTAWMDAMERAKNRLEIIVAKQRQGEIGTAHVRFNPALNVIWEDAR